MEKELVSVRKVWEIMNKWKKNCDVIVLCIYVYNRDELYIWMEILNLQIQKVNEMEKTKYQWCELKY